MKGTKRFLCSILVAGLLLAGCGNDTDTSSTTSSEAESNTASTSSTATADNESGLPIVAEPVTYELVCSLSGNWKSPEDGIFWQDMEEKTNVHIEWTTFLDSEKDEKFSLMMTSGDYKDGFIGGLGGDNNIVEYGTQGIYIPLNDLIDQYAPNFLKKVEEVQPDIINRITTTDGSIYAMPSLLYNPVIYNNTFINKDWLDQVGMDVPTTTDEFEEVLKAFKDKDLNGNGENDEIPMTFMFNDWGASDHGPYFGSFGYPLSPDYTLIDSGTVHYLGAESSFKDGAEWLASLYAQGLIDKECFTQDGSALTAKAASGVLGVFSAWAATDAGDYADQYVLLETLKGPNGEQNALKEGITGFYRDSFIITDKAENPEILIKWVDQFYVDDEVGMNATYGIGPGEDMAWNYDDQGNMVMNENTPEGYARGQQQLPFAPAILGDKARYALDNMPENKVKSEDTEILLQYAGKFNDGTWERWPSCFMTVDESEELSILDTDLQSYSKNMLAKWIAGESDVNQDWDSYLEELNKIGLDRWLELKQQIYDRYSGK